MQDIILLTIDSSDAPHYLGVFIEQYEKMKAKIMQLENDLAEEQNRLSRIENNINLLNSCIEINNVTNIVGNIQSNFPPLSDEVHVGDKISLNLVNGNGYEPKASWWRKVNYFLEKEQNGLTKNQIMEKIIEKEPELKNISERRKRTNSISLMSTLSTKAFEGKLTKEKKEKAKDFSYKLA